MMGNWMAKFCLTLNSGLVHYANDTRERSMRFYGRWRAQHLSTLPGLRLVEKATVPAFAWCTSAGNRQGRGGDGGSPRRGRIFAQGPSALPAGEFSWRAGKLPRPESHRVELSSEAGPGCV
ncbi:hypothetical protein CMUS01_00407 [Colletotrichum musicola]|uniref:Uncharacterized protein n=1 Tax=Colletotrichum musicola TaxID=2175873 RepID=A0A8H6NZ01_9PEZI|nr:hypothetical protein CMUS01_00407 [Colletotrichum musicola]